MISDLSYRERHQAQWACATVLLVGRLIAIVGHFRDGRGGVESPE